MLKKHWENICHVILIVLLALLLLVVCVKSSQTPTAMPQKLIFQGEYSQNGGAWLPLEETTQLSALDGELILRGRFDCDLPEDRTISFYLDHIEYCVYVNGEYVMSSSSWAEGVSASTCVRGWGSLTLPGATGEYIVEIHLRNSHRFGNTRAYSEFLDSIYPCSLTELKAAFEPATLLPRSAGLLIVILSVVTIGIALAFSVTQVPVSRQLWSLGLMSFFAGGYIMLDTADVFLWGSLNVFHTYAQQLCMMLAVLEFGMFIASYLSANAKKAAQAAVLVQGTFLAAIAVLCLTGQILIYDTLPFWVLIQVIACPALLICCVHQWRQRQQKSSAVLPSCVLLLIAVMLDLANLSLLWWPEGVVTKTVFFLLFIFHSARSIKNIPADYQRSVQANKLAEDLNHSRSILAMSQIRTHFVFNVLNAISGMCKYDPEKADKTVICFSRYLRANIDIMQDDQPISFRSELRHLEDYITLEQIRFGDKFQFATDITADDFLLPPLTLQPIVENSIKHGLTPKASGGTITLRTWLEGDQILISVQDDGVGFDPDILNSKQSIGLKNVRFRLHHFMNGKLDIESALGQGTTVTISISCEEAKKCV